MRALILTLALLCGGQAAWAADDSKTKAQKVYDGIMSDSDIYAGEGVVTLASFGGDINRAKASGRERARGNMVESIRVRIVSKTTDTQSSGPGGSKENIEAQSSSTADLELEGIQYKYLDDYPKNGQLTVLAFLSKEEYQRQSDKRMLGYRPLRALRLSGGTISTNSFSDYMYKYSGSPAGAVFLNGSQSSSDSQAPISLAADFYWNGFLVGAAVTTGRTPVTAVEALPITYKNVNNPWSVSYARLGYEWTPWATRFQVALPIQAEYAIVNWDPFFSSGFGLSGGLSLRYWSTDRVAFDLTGKWHQGLSKSDLVDRSGKTVLFRPGEPGTFETTGPEVTVGILWNGF